MANLTRSPEFLDLLVGIELRLRALGWIEVSRQGNQRQVFVRNSRLINWAVSCCHQTIPADVVAALADARSADKQWWILRQLLPDAAIVVLANKLDLMLTAKEDLPLNS